MDTDTSSGQSDTPSGAVLAGHVAGDNGRPAGWLSVVEAAHAAGQVSIRTMRRWAARGLCESVRSGAEWYIKPGSWPSPQRTLRPRHVVPPVASLDVAAFADKLAALADAAGYWRGQAENVQKLLTGGQADAARARADADQALTAAARSRADVRRGRAVAYTFAAAVVLLVVAAGWWLPAVIAAP